MAKRRTKHGDPVVDTTPLAPLKTVAQYFSPVEAHLARGLLEAEGVQCVLGNELFTNMDSPVGVATGGVWLQVRASDYARAADILNARTQEAGEESGTSPAKPSPWAWLAGLLLLSLLGGLLWSVFRNLASLGHP